MGVKCIEFYAGLAVVSLFNTWPPPTSPIFSIHRLFNLQTVRTRGTLLMWRVPQDVLSARSSTTSIAVSQGGYLDEASGDSQVLHRINEFKTRPHLTSKTKCFLSVVPP